MPTESPAFLQDRLTKLEVDFRRMRRLAMGALVLIGAFLGSSLSRKGPVSGRLFSLVNSEGEKRLTLQVGEKGEVEVMMFEGETVKAKGTIRAKDGKIEVGAAGP